MKRYFLLATLLCFSLCFAQRNEILNPKGKWYFGIEIGENKNYQSENEKPESIQFGILTEYYFLKQWSLQAKIKYYKTFVSYNINDNYSLPATSGGFFLFNLSNSSGRPYEALHFEGDVISIPLYLKWEFRLFRNLKANIFAGPSYNFEVESNYWVPGYQNPDVSMFPQNYFGFGLGFGLNYFFKTHWVFCYSVEFSSGGYKGSYDGLLGTTRYFSQNGLWNIGVKYNFN